MADPDTRPDTTPDTTPGTTPDTTPTPAGGVAAIWLALIAGPLSFGIAGPALILDQVARDLAASTDAVTWAVTAFGWGIAVGTPLMAGLLRHRGVRTAVLAAAVLVVLGAAMILAVPTLPTVILGSALQALGTAGLVSVAMSVAGSSRQMGLVTASLAIVGAVAPLAGSTVAGALGWQAALALPLLSVLGIPAVLRGAPTLPVTTERFDAAGAVLLTAVVTALVFIPNYPLPAVVAAVVTVAALLAWVRRRPSGFVPAAAGRVAFVVPSVLAFLFAVVNFGLIYALPIRLGDVTSWSSSETGVAMVWPLLFGGALSFVVVAASARLGRNRVAVVLAVLALVVAPVLAFASGWAALLLLAQAAASLAAASGQGVFALQASAALPDEERPRAIGLFNLAYLLGAAFGPALAVLLVS